jgi:hypothetical protein
MNPLQQKAYDAVTAALPLRLIPRRSRSSLGCPTSRAPSSFTTMPGGVMAAFGSVVEYIGSLRGLPSSRKMLTARRPCARYVVGVGVKLQMALMTNIPTWVRDQVLQRVSGQP